MGLYRSTPVSEILLRSVRIVRTGDAARDFDAEAAFARQADVRARREAASRAASATFRAQLERDLAQAVRTASGLLYLVLAPGSGEPPRPGDTVVTECTGWLEKDGTRFWSTSDGGAPFRVKVGAGKLIKAWEEAFGEMRPGEKRRLIVPPELGYGAQGNVRAGIPANATLVFDVELVDIERH
jgi:peptidylprolyl isomerase